MKVLIIEDEELAAERLQRLLQQLDPALEVVGQTDSIVASVNWLKSNPAPDLIFADIHLADGASFEIFSRTQTKVPVIFTTAYDQYAIQAFQYNSIGYVLKPIKKSELEEALNKFKSLQQPAPAPDFQELLQALSGITPAYQKRIVIRFGHNIRIIEISEVAYFYTEEKVTLACTFEGKRWPVDHNLDELEHILDPTQFFRINRQFIINIQAIEAMHSYSKSRVKIDLKPASDMDTIVSTERSANFKQWLLGK